MKNSGAEPDIMSEDNYSPFISVVIPVYNGENYLREAVESVLCQTYTNYEIIIVDDGSTDGTWAIIESYNDKVRGFHKENGGVSSALNLAIENMNGDWFAWLSHDDLWLPDKLEKQILWMQNHPGCGMYYAGGYSISQNGYNITLPPRGIWYPKGRNTRRLIKGNYIVGITTLINKECFKKIGTFNEAYRCIQDLDMWIRISMEYDLSLLPEPLVKSRVHRSQVGVRSAGKCRKEFREMQSGYITTLQTEILYPKLRGNNINYFEKIIQKSRAFRYRFWMKTVCKYNIPSYIDIIAYIVSRTPKSIIKIVIKMLPYTPKN